MAVLIDHQSINFPPGTRTAEAAVAGGQEILVRVARQTTATPTFWGPAVSLSVNIEVSVDGGATWAPTCGMTALGGITPSRTGGESPESVVGCRFPAGTNRARVTVVIAGGTLVSQLTVESV